MAYSHTTLDDIIPHHLEKGNHQPGRPPQLFIDSCVQIWEDTDYSKLHTYSPSAYAPTIFMPHDGPERALDAIANWYRIEREYPKIRIAHKAEDIVEAHATGGVAIIITSQGGDFLGNHLHRLDLFHALGLRMMLPSYNKRNTLCDGCLEPDNAGLSRLGHEWVKACNRLGIVIDLTHVGVRSSFEIMEASEDPVVFSHSNPKALVDHYRNITDEQIKACAATGGVIAPTNFAPFNLPANQTTRPTLSQYLDAIDYVVQLVGIDHVGIGTDKSHGSYPDGDLIRRGFADGIEDNQFAKHIEVAPRSRLWYVDGFDDYGQLPSVIDALNARGYSDEDVNKILSGNFLRVFRAVW